MAVLFLVPGAGYVGVLRLCRFMELHAYDAFISLHLQNTSIDKLLKDSMVIGCQPENKRNIYKSLLI